MRSIPRGIKRGAAALLAGTVGLGTWLFLGLPSRSEVRDLARRVPERTSVMRQREAEAGAAGRRIRHLQTTVPLRSISRNLIHAVLSAEDPKFFGHEGIDWDAIRESIETNIERRAYARGGSTITQQLAKNLFFTTHKSLVRKAREAVVATWMEQELSKKRILEIYLNVIEWGEGVYGCEAAARQYYGASCASLSVDQAAGLAAMIPSPLRINPRTHPALHARATRRVLRRMRAAGYLTRSIKGLGTAPEPIPPEEAGTPSPSPTPPPTGRLGGGGAERVGLSSASVIEFPS